MGSTLPRPSSSRPAPSNLVSNENGNIKATIRQNSPACRGAGRGPNGPFFSTTFSRPVQEPVPCVAQRLILRSSRPRSPAERGAGGQGVDRRSRLEAVICSPGSLRPSGGFLLRLMFFRLWLSDDEAVQETILRASLRSMKRCNGSVGEGRKSKCL